MSRQCRSGRHAQIIQETHTVGALRKSTSRNVRQYVFDFFGISRHNIRYICTTCIDFARRHTKAKLQHDEKVSNVCHCYCFALCIHLCMCHLITNRSLFLIQFLSVTDVWLMLIVNWFHQIVCCRYQANFLMNQSRCKRLSSLISTPVLIVPLCWSCLPFKTEIILNRMTYFHQGSASTSCTSEAGSAASCSADTSVAATPGDAAVPRGAAPELEPVLRSSAAVGDDLSSPIGDAAQQVSGLVTCEAYVNTWHFSRARYLLHSSSKDRQSAWLSNNGDCLHSQHIILSEIAVL